MSVRRTSYRPRARTWRSSFDLVTWFLRELPRYLGRVIADRREDRAELRADRRLVAARRKAEIAEIRAARREHPHTLPVPAWISRIERPQRPQGGFPVPRRALVAGALVLAAAVPGYAVVSGALESDGPAGLAADPYALPGSTPMPAATAGTQTPDGAVAGVPTDPGVPAVPGAPASPVVASATGASATPAVAQPGTVKASAPLSAHQLHQQRVERRLARAEAKLKRDAAAFARDPGK